MYFQPIAVHSADWLAVLIGRLGADYRYPWEELGLAVKARASFAPLVRLK